jgi:hypothetical protein
LASNRRIAFIGCDIKGQGFLFDDYDAESTPIQTMQLLIAKTPDNANRIAPYIGGEEVNDSPTQTPHRYVIAFGEMSEEDARRWPDLLAILEKKVKPDREKKSKELAQWPWWQFWRVRGELSAAVSGKARVLVCPIISNKLSFVLLPASYIFSHKLAVFALSSYAAFAGLQARCHEIWARMFASTMKDDLNYSPSDCFETFPFPEGFESHPKLEGAGKEYYDFRAALMVRNNEGLTKTYNRFHDPSERSADILKLRELHAAMDRAVLDAYGWTDLRPTCEFLLDYEDDEDEEEGGGRRRRKPWRYRWPDDFRDEVLARLLELNKRRAEQEALAGATANAPWKTGRRKAAPKDDRPGLFSSTE